MSREMGEAASIGQWAIASEKFSHLPIHVAVLQTGTILAFGGSGNDETHLTTPHPAELWNPVTEDIRTVKQDLAGDVFCAGHSFLSDGRLLVAGGTSKYDGKLLFGDISFPPFRGLAHTYLFDPETEQWTRTEDMCHSRWYPTLVTLGDGSVLTAAGLTEHFPWVALREIERYRPGTGWETVPGADRWLPLYPRLHLLPDGSVFYAGSYNTHYTFPFSLRSFPTGTLDVSTGQWRNLGLPNEAQRQEGASVLLPLTSETDYRPEVLLVGGGTPGGGDAVADAEIIDLGHPNPQWQPVDPMAHPRYYTYAVLLPNRHVLVVGGHAGTAGHHATGSFDNYADGEVSPSEHAVLEAEVFDPETRSWTTLAPMSVDRLYHSNAVLLPDGRVMTAGSNPKRRINELRIEVFSPPYLFDGPRPVIDDAPEEISYGMSFTVTTVNAPDIDEIALIRPSATTHCVNTSQRYVGLSIEAQEADRLQTQLPDNANLVPPGYYMLFLIRDGVPSEAVFVRVPIAQ